MSLSCLMADHDLPGRSSRDHAFRPGFCVGGDRRRHRPHHIPPSRPMPVSHSARQVELSTAHTPLSPRGICCQTCMGSRCRCRAHDKRAAVAAAATPTHELRSAHAYAVAPPPLPPPPTPSKVWQHRPQTAHSCVGIHTHARTHTHTPRIYHPTTLTLLRLRAAPPRA
jgi:hypothetical protein